MEHLQSTEEKTADTQPEWDEWPWFDQLEVDDTFIHGPIVLKESGVVTQMYFGFTVRPDAEKLWKGPRDCSNPGSELAFSCTGTFLGWAAYEATGDVRYTVWLIKRMEVEKPRAPEDIL